MRDRVTLVKIEWHCKGRGKKMIGQALRIEDLGAASRTGLVAVQLHPARAPIHVGNPNVVTS